MIKIIVEYWDEQDNKMCTLKYTLENFAADFNRKDPVLYPEINKPGTRIRILDE
jgi:hypothetical protein